MLSADDAFVLPIRIHPPAPGLTQCILACICRYIRKTRPGRQRGPGQRAQPQARLTWGGKAYVGLQGREGTLPIKGCQGCHCSQDLFGGWREGVGGRFGRGVNRQPSPTLPPAQLLGQEASGEVMTTG